MKRTLATPAKLLRESLIKLTREREEILAAIGGDEFLNPPEDGDVTIAEQVRRLRAAYNEARDEVDELRFEVRELVRKLLAPQQPEPLAASPFGSPPHQPEDNRRQMVFARAIMEVVVEHMGGD